MTIDELWPVLDRFVAQEGLLVASCAAGAPREGFDREALVPSMKLALYPPSPTISPQMALDNPGPAHAITLRPPVPVDNFLIMFHVGVRFDWLENGEIHVDREVVPRFDRLKRRLLKVMCFGPYEAYCLESFPPPHVYHGIRYSPDYSGELNPEPQVYRGTHYSQGALEWLKAGREWIPSLAGRKGRVRYRPHSECLVLRGQDRTDFENGGNEQAGIEGRPVSDSQ